MKLLALMGVLTMSTPLASTTIQTNSIVKNQTLIDDNDGYERILKSQDVYDPVENARIIRVSKKYGEDNPVFNNLRKPNTWENFWYDLLLVNGFNDKETDSTYKDHMKKSLDKIRTSMGIDDVQISNRIGDLVHGRPQIVRQDTNKLSSFSFTNTSNINQTYLTDAFTHEETSTQRWNVNGGFSLNYSASATINFFGTSASASTSYSFNINAGYEQQKTVKETIHSPSQTIVLEPHTKTTLDWYLSNSLFKIQGGVDYKANQYFSKDLLQEDKPIVLDVNWNLISDISKNDLMSAYMSRTLWLIANRGPVKYFTKDSNDLFIINGTAEYPHTNDEWKWGGKVVSYTYNIPVEYYINGLSVEYNINSTPL